MRDDAIVGARATFVEANGCADRDLEPAPRASPALCTEARCNLAFRPPCRESSRGAGRRELRTCRLVSVDVISDSSSSGGGESSDEDCGPDLADSDADYDPEGDSPAPSEGDWESGRCASPRLCQGPAAPFHRLLAPFSRLVPSPPPANAADPPIACSAARSDDSEHSSEGDVARQASDDDDLADRTEARFLPSLTPCCAC